MRIVEFTLLAVMVALALPTVIAVLLLRPPPRPPAVPDWRPVYDALEARGDTANARRVLRTTVGAMDPEALLYCADHPANPACGFSVELSADALRQLAGDLKSMASEQLAQTGRRPLRPALETLAIVEARVRERRAAGVRYALADGWLYARCVQPYVKAHAFAWEVVNVLREIEGKKPRRDAFGRALVRCAERAADFAHALNAGSYGTPATAYLEEWQKYAEFLAGMGTQGP